MLISVITPVYNEEKNIYKCYECLSRQSLKNFEWILIDDGSTDRSIEIIESIIRTHNKDLFNILFLKQKNSGPASARDSGIRNAKGEFICQLDCDDYLSSDALALATEKISDNIDIICFNVNYVNQDGTSEGKLQYTIDTWPITGKEVFGESIDGWEVGMSLIRKSLYDSINITFESQSNITTSINYDELTARYIFYNARLIEHCEGTYYYVSNPDSITNKINKNFYKFVYTAIKFYDFIQEKKDKDIEYPYWDLKIQLHLLITFNTVLGRYLLWRNVIDNHNEWIRSLYAICSYIDLSKILINNKTIRKRKSLGYGYILKGCIKVIFVRLAGFILNFKK